jgi:hypothetical protein
VKATSQISASYAKNSFWPLRLARSPQAALSFDWEFAYSRQECSTPETKTLRSVQIRAFYQLESVQERRNLSLPASAVPCSLYSLMLTSAGFRRVDIARYQYCMPYPTYFALTSLASELCSRQCGVVIGKGSTNHAAASLLPDLQRFQG